MKSAAKFEGNTSKANGSLMRATPLGIYGYQLTDEELAFIASQDSSLSHTNPSVCAAVASYIIGIHLEAVFIIKF
jgi:ADP-ribosyl-[dinitrogen reductase] hydrolase